MSITFKRGPGIKLCELGGGSNPRVHPKCLGGQDVHIDARMCTNQHNQKCVDIVHNLASYPWPSVNNDEFDGVVAIFVLEHIPYTKTLGFLKESFRICKPGSKSIFVIPNTEEQVKWILDHPEGWDGKNFFTSASEKLFGSQDDTVKEQEVHAGSYHAAYFNPSVVSLLFKEAGFDKVLIQPYGDRKTDMVIEATKGTNAPVAQTPQEHLPVKEKVGEGTSEVQAKPPTVNTSEHQYTGPNVPNLSTKDREKLFNHKYFEKYPGSRLGFYFDFPNHEVAARKILEKKPENVLELGCGRGYLLKRLEDKGIQCRGFDISTHVYLTRVSNKVEPCDLISNWKGSFDEIDLCLSVGFLDCVPEAHLDELIEKISVSNIKRGLHAVNFLGQEPYPDVMRCTVKPKEWWTAKLPANHEVISVYDLMSGGLPDDYINGDGKTKLNVGCAWTMFHNGWHNLDVIDANAFASQYKFNFKMCDAKKPLPYGTGVVDMIYSSHMLEHFTYAEGLSFLRDCRRVIRNDGAMRLVMPDGKILMGMYADDGSLLSMFDEVNENCAKAPTPAGKVWALLHENHQACYDSLTLENMLRDSGWIPKPSLFRIPLKNERCQQILQETCEMSYGFSLFMDAIPEVK